LQTDTRLTTFFPGQPVYASTRKVKPFWILMKQEMMRWQWHQLHHMQIICNSLQTYTTPASHRSIFYRLGALPDTQPTVSKH